MSVVPEWPSRFPYFLQFKSEFCNKELMIWATFSSWSCFCWLYRASPSLAAKNIINLIFIDSLLMSMCRVISWVVGKEYLLWPVCSLDKTLLVFALLHFVFPSPITCLLFQVSFDFLLLHSSPLWWKGYFFGIRLEGVIRLHRTSQLQHQ